MPFSLQLCCAYASPSLPIHYLLHLFVSKTLWRIDSEDLMVEEHHLITSHIISTGNPIHPSHSTKASPAAASSRIPNKGIPAGVEDADVYFNREPPWPGQVDWSSFRHLPEFPNAWVVSLIEIELPDIISNLNSSFSNTQKRNCLFPDFSLPLGTRRVP